MTASDQALAEPLAELDRIGESYTVKMVMVSLLQ